MIIPHKAVAIVPAPEVYIRPTPPDGREAPSDATAEAEALVVRDVEVVEAEADCPDEEAADVDDEADTDADPLLVDTARAASPTSIESMVLFPVAAFWYQGRPQASAIFFTSQPSVRAGCTPLKASTWLSRTSWWSTLSPCDRSESHPR